MELHNQAFTTLGAAEQQAVREDAEERYISYAFLRQSGLQHGTLKVELQHDFTTGDNRYPKNRQQTLHLVDKYSKSTMTKTTPSEGTSFVQKGGRGNGATKDKGKPFDKEYWKDKECFMCKKKGHPASHCSRADDDKDNKSSSSKARSVKKARERIQEHEETFYAIT
jgi:hypothetical protein